MLISVNELDKSWNIHPTGVLHVGAHLAEESNDYNSHNWGKVVWVEAQTSLVNILKETLDPTRNSIFEAVIWDVDNELKKFGVASNSQSSSLLEFDTHSESYPDIKMVEYREIRTVRLDSLLVGETIGNFLNLDIQGAELPAIKSLGVRIQEIDFIYTEVNRKELYEKCTRVEELDIYLSDLGFLRKATRWYAREGWGDALYIRESIELNRTLFRKIQFKTGNIRFLLFQFARNAWHSILPTKNRQHPFV